MGVINKKKYVKATVKENHGCSGICAKCTRIHALIDKMCDSNIPVGYWFLTMKDFSGEEKLREIYEDYIKHLHERYMEGKSICFAGNQGTGKTMSSICILKVALKKGFSVHYITASDILNNLTDYQNSSRLRETLRTVDFLVIDELDSRFFISDAVKELFSGIYENIFRFRSHNMLPTIMCTNETEGILNVFGGHSKQAIESLNKQYLTLYPIIGKDFRNNYDKKVHIS